jgi:hypothetical protein
MPRVRFEHMVLVGDELAASHTGGFIANVRLPDTHLVGARVGLNTEEK